MLKKLFRYGRLLFFHLSYSYILKVWFWYYCNISFEGISFKPYFTEQFPNSKILIIKGSCINHAPHDKTRPHMNYILIQTDAL